MRQRILPAAFVAAFLLLAVLILSHEHPGLILSAPAQGDTVAVRVLPVKVADRPAAVAVIRAQLKALQKGDFARVVQYQSSGLRHHFSTVAAFRHMMQTAYPAFLHFQSFSFGPASVQDAGVHLAIPVTLREGNGPTLKALYLMVREGTGYKVDGVVGGMAPPPAAIPSQMT